MCTSGPSRSKTSRLISSHVTLTTHQRERNNNHENSIDNSKNQAKWAHPADCFGHACHVFASRRDLRGLGWFIEVSERIVCDKSEEFELNYQRDGQSSYLGCDPRNQRPEVSLLHEQPSWGRIRTEPDQHEVWSLFHSQFGVYVFRLSKRYQFNQGRGGPKCESNAPVGS
jgi:hypothetical protein